MEMSRPRRIEVDSEEYWALFECPPRNLPPGVRRCSSSASTSTPVQEPSKRVQELQEATKYSGQMEAPEGHLILDGVPHSLIQSLGRRELGLPSRLQTSATLENHMKRQLQVARAPTAASSTFTILPAIEVKGGQIPRKGQVIRPLGPPIGGSGRDQNKKWSRIRAGSATGSGGPKYKFTFLDNVILMKEGGSNTRRVLLPTPPIFTGSSPYRVQFSLEDRDKTKRKWRDHDLRLFNLDNPQMVEVEGVGGGSRKVAPIPNSLLVLESTGKLVRYDFNTGNKMEELDLTYPGGPLYSTLVVDHDVGERGILVIANSAAVKKCQPGMLLEVLIISSSYPGLKVTHRLLFPKGGEFGVVDDVTLLGDLLITSTPTHLQFFDFDQVLAENPPRKCGQSTTSAEGMEPSHPPDEGDGRLILTKKPASLGRFRAREGMFSIIEATTPPTICVKRNDVYEVRCLGDPDEILGEIIAKTPEGDVKLFGYDKWRPRIIVTGLPHGFDIMQIDTVEKSLKVIYSTKTFEDQESLALQGNGGNGASSSGDTPNSSSSSDTTPRRRGGLRQQVKKNYGDMERSKTFGFGYHCDLDLLAVCMMVDGTLKTTILNNETLKPAQILSPVQLSRPKGVANLGCSAVEVQFSETSLGVQLSLYDADSTASNFEEIYTANLIGELLSDPVSHELTS